MFGPFGVCVCGGGGGTFTKNEEHALTVAAVMFLFTSSKQAYNREAIVYKWQM